MLEKTCLITALLGIILLLIFSQMLEPPLKEISEINDKMLEEWVRVNGIVIKIKETDGLFILDLKSNKEESSITVIAYKNKARISVENIEKDLHIEVTGKVIEYYSKLEIEASKIKLL